MLTPEQRYRLLSDHPLDAVYASGPDHVCRWISPSITTISGWTPEDLVGTRIEELVHPEDRDEGERIRRLLHLGQVVPEAAVGRGAPLRVRRKDGSYTWASILAVPVLAEDGSPDGLVGRIRDVDELVRARQRAEEGEARVEAILDALVDPLALMEAVRDEGGGIIDLRFLDLNAAALAVIGQPKQALLGRRFLDLQPVSAEPFGHLARAIDTGEVAILDDLRAAGLPPGGERRIDLRGVPVGEQIVVTWRDNTERYRQQLALARSEELYRLVTDGMTDAVVRWDDDRRISWVSPSFHTLAGYSPAEVIGHQWTEFLDVAHEANPGGLVHRLTEASGEDIRARLRRADGRSIWVSAASRPFVRASGDRDGYVTALRDVTREVEIHERLEHEIGHDTLTGLANKDLGIERIERALEEISGSWRTLVMLCIGVDGLTTINESLTYQGGDQVLAEIAARITSVAGSSDAVARIAGDEFAMIFPDLTGGVAGASVAQRICAAVNEPVRVNGHVVRPTVSIGIATAVGAVQADALLRDASLAMRQAKRVGPGRYAFVDPAMAAQAAGQLSVEESLRTALGSGEIVPWFMPIVAFEGRRVTGFEALARWVHADGTVVPPGVFISVAERSGLIVDVDFRVLEGSLAVMRSLPAEVTMAVNISAPTLNSPRFAERVRIALEQSGVAPHRLKLEVTETALVQVTEGISRAVQAVADLGVRWFVDDFGTGYSSISHLRDLPISGLKLDQSFTFGIAAGDATSVSLASGLAGLAAGLRLDTVAEGVESEPEAAMLHEQGWRLGQGYLFGKPSPFVVV